MTATDKAQTPEPISLRSLHWKALPRDEVTRNRPSGARRPLLWTYGSPELCELLVLNRGWPAERYSTFIADAMIAALLPPQPPDPW